MHLSPDQIIFWQMGFFKLNATIVSTWAVMLLLVITSILVTRKISTDLHRSRWQNILEVVVINISKQIEEVSSSQVSWLSRFSVSVYCHLGSRDGHSRIRATNWLTFHNRCTCPVCICGRTLVRHSREWLERLSVFLCKAVHYYAAI